MTLIFNIPIRHFRLSFVMPICYHINCVMLHMILYYLGSFSVNRMLSNYQGYLSHHAVIMALKPERVGGKATTTFKHFTPPDDG